MPNSPDGTVSLAPNGAPLNTSLGTWTWGAATSQYPGNYEVLLNGSWGDAASGAAVLMVIENGGYLYVQVAVGQWYVWNGYWATTGTPPGWTGGGGGGGGGQTPNVAPNDARLAYAPGAWVVSSATAVCVNPGNSVRTVCGTQLVELWYAARDLSSSGYGCWSGPAQAVKFLGFYLDSSGNLTAYFDVSTVVGSPVVAWSVGGSAFTRVTLSQSSTPQAISLGTVGTTLSLPTLRPKRALVFGDSSLEGAQSIGSYLTPDGQDATQCFGVLLGYRLNAEVGVIGFAGQGYEQGGFGGVPALLSAWSSIYSGQSRGGTFDYIVVAHGINGATTASDVQSLLTALRSWQAGAEIFVAVPWTGDAEAAVVAGFNQYQAAVPDAGCKLADVGNLANGQTIGTYPKHPNVRGHARYAAALGGAF